MSGEPEFVVTYTIRIARNGDVTNDVDTHGNSFAEVYRAFQQIRAEVQRQIDERRMCPANPRYGEATLEPAEDATPPTVHVLHHGLPLCRFSTALPADWPAGHKWTGLDAPADATCEGCVAHARTLSALRGLYRLGPRPWIPGADVTWPEWDQAHAAADAAIGATTEEKR